MSSVPTKRYLTVSEYLALERAAETRHEYFDGRMYAMAGASEPHNRIVSNVNFALQSRMRPRGCVVYQSDMRVHSRLNNRDHFAYPDLLMLCGESKHFDSDQDTLTNPQLIIEVLSPSTERFDRGTKFERYRAIPSFREYVLISQQQHIVERFLRQEDDMWLLHIVRGEHASLTLATVAEPIPLREIYHSVTLLTGVNDDVELPPSA